MAPNLFLCLRTVFCPIYWFRPSIRVEGSICGEEHWDSPVPGTYRYVPRRGWYLIRRDDAPNDEGMFPEPVVYCRIIHRHLLASDMEERCQWHTVVSPDDPSSTPREYRFFQLDDGICWVAGWDAKGEFIPGPYRRWCFDKESLSMRPMKSRKDLGAGSRMNSSTSAFNA